MAQLVKKLPAMQETWVQSLCWEDPLEKAKGSHSRIPAWRIPRAMQFKWSERFHTTDCLSLYLLLHYSEVQGHSKEQE